MYCGRNKKDLKKWITIRIEMMRFDGTRRENEYFPMATMIFFYFDQSAFMLDLNSCTTTRVFGLYHLFRTGLFGTTTIFCTRTRFFGLLHWFLIFGRIHWLWSFQADFSENTDFLLWKCSNVGRWTRQYLLYAFKKRLTPSITRF